jgi:hypothetical protein
VFVNKSDLVTYCSGLSWTVIGWFVPVARRVLRLAQ